MNVLAQEMPAQQSAVSWASNQGEHHFMPLMLISGHLLLPFGTKKARSYIELWLEA